mmetsp:Transcript_15407/g.26299  ORF Transcript_15407/g.26299 Transcript_15407/m.26299 type:complete len:102 (-) Transcript_15407:717-1022(-)
MFVRVFRTKSFMHDAGHRLHEDMSQNAIPCLVTPPGSTKLMVETIFSPHNNKIFLNYHSQYSNEVGLTTTFIIVTARLDWGIGQLSLFCSGMYIYASGTIS